MIRQNSGLVSIDFPGQGLRESHSRNESRLGTSSSCGRSSQGKKSKKRFKIQVKGSTKENLGSSNSLVTQQTTLRQKSLQNLNEGIRKLKNKSAPRIPPTLTPPNTGPNADLNLSLAVTEKKYSPPVNEKHIEYDDVRQNEEESRN